VWGSVVGRGECGCYGESVGDMGRVRRNVAGMRAVWLVRGEFEWDGGSVFCFAAFFKVNLCYTSFEIHRRKQNFLERGPQGT
jgi:hypothetical protein